MLTYANRRSPNLDINFGVPQEWMEIEYNIYLDSKKERVIVAKYPYQYVAHIRSVNGLRVMFAEYPYVFPDATERETVEYTYTGKTPLVVKVKEVDFQFFVLNWNWLPWHSRRDLLVHYSEKFPTYLKEKERENGYPYTEEARVWAFDSIVKEQKYPWEIVAFPVVVDEL